MERALEVEIERAEVPDLLWGIGLGPREVQAVSGDFAGWVPEVKTLGTNLYTVYNAVTAYNTYRPSGGAHLKATEFHARQAFRLIESADYDWPDLLDKGALRREAHEEKLKEKEAAKAVSAFQGA